MKGVLIVAFSATAALLFGVVGLSFICCGDDETYTGYAVVGYVTDADTGKPIPWRQISFTCNSHMGWVEWVGQTKTGAKGYYVLPDPAYSKGETIDTILEHKGHRVTAWCHAGGGYNEQHKTIYGFANTSLPERVDFQLDPIPTE